MLSNEVLNLAVTGLVGPRVISLSLSDGENLFADLPELTLDCPGVGPYHIYGGHRLWHAPEDPHRTYLPDDDPVEVTEFEHGLIVSQQPEPQTGLQKKLRIQLLDNNPWVVVDHELKNVGLWPVEASVWAITQLKIGGTAILPQFSGTSDPGGLLPNRNLALWQYSDIQDEIVVLGNRYIFVNASLDSGAFKIGFPNPRGWLAYHLDNTLFVKYAPYNADSEYFDQGSSSECYCGPEFLELETLGPRTTIMPGDSAKHREVWRVIGDVPFVPLEDRMDEIVKEFDLEGGEAGGFFD